MQRPAPPVPGPCTPRRRMALATALVLAATGFTASMVTSPASAATIDEGTWYTLVNRHSGKALDVSGKSTADGAMIQQWTRNGGGNQQFRFESAASGWWRVVARHSGKAVDLWGWNTADGAEYRQWPVTSGYNQQFQARTQSDGYVRFVNRHSGKALEVWEWSTSDGGRISQYADHGGYNQQWQLVKEGSSGGSGGNSGGGSSGGGSPSGSWPSASGSVKVSSTISVSGTFDGGMKRYYGIGDGGQSESQDPMFKLSDGATIKNVVIGAPAGDGIHCTGRCTIQNVWWEDVGEDAATFKGTSGDSYVIGGGAKSASDKVFQHNGSGTVHISGFYAASIGKLYRACGNCSSSYQRHVRVDNVLLDSAKYVVGINSNWGDTATLSRITLVNGSKTHVCAKYKGVSKGSEPSYLGDGWNDGNCKVSQSDVTYR